MEIGDREPADEPLEHRLDPGALVVRAYGLGAGPRGFAANVDQVGAGRHHLQRRVRGARGVHEVSAVSERIRGDVQHAHHEGPLAELEGAPPGSDTVKCCRGAMTSGPSDEGIGAWDLGQA